MNDIGHIGESRSSHPIAPDKRYPRHKHQGRANRQLEDAVDVSALARLLSQLESLPDIRLEKVSQVRAAIERGNYETTGKIDITIDRLVQELGG